MSKVIVDEIQTNTTNGNVRVIPNGTGALEVKGAGGDDAMLQLNCSAQSHGVKIKSPAHSVSQSYTMILPDNNIAADKYLKVASIVSGSGTSAVGQLEFADVTLPSTLTGSANLSGLLREGVNITAGKLSDNTNIDLENGMVHLFTTAETTTSTPNIRFNSSTTLNSKMSVGEAISVTIITTAAAAAYSAQLTIDGAAVTENWVGGSAPSDGGSSGVDIYAYTIIKEGNNSYYVIGNQSKTS
tara:strand:- start:967 stop:1692 length:726 start_codon:yes stop_codon:yes gene_type:complete